MILNDFLLNVHAYYQEHECTEEFNSITETTASVFLQALCHSIKTNLDDVDWIISRMKAECIITTYPGGQNTEKSKKK